MVDPNFAFDWDQWEAVFGQQLSMAADLVEVDPVVGMLGSLSNSELGIDLYDQSASNNMNNLNNGQMNVEGQGDGNTNEMAAISGGNDAWRNFETWQY